MTDSLARVPCPTLLLLAMGVLLAVFASVALNPLQAQHATAPSTTKGSTTTYAPYPGDSAGKVQRVDVRSSGGSPGSRRFELSSTAVQRDSGSQRRTIAEHIGSPFVSTGNSLFDALFAMSVDDARLASVSAIRDGAYNDDSPIACHCFETGEKWHYVWTRDLTYALNLGLAGLDPQRSVTSLLFKTSGFRAGVPVPPELPDSSPQIIVRDGRYGGEHSFLDWRQQSYAP